MFKRTLCAASVVAAVLLLLLVSPALAHSSLVSSNPPAGAKLDKSPAAVVMTFSEGAQTQFSTFAVVDRARKHVEVAQPPIFDAKKGQVTVPLQPDLPGGAYTVQWKVVSAVDGHITRGSFVFTVKGPPATAAPAGPSPTPAPAGSLAATTPTIAEPTPAPDEATAQDSTQETPAASFGDVAVRWLGFLLAAIIVGGAGFTLLILPVGLRRLSNARSDVQTGLERRFARFALAASGLLLLALLGEVLLEGARVTETGVLAVLGDASVIGGVLAGNYGFYVLVRLALTLVIGILLLGGLLTRRLQSPLWIALIVLGAGYYLAETLGGHAAAISQGQDVGLLQALAPVTNVIHLLATGFWIGGIFYFVAVLLPRLPRLDPDSRLAILRDSIGRFSPFAIGSVVLLVITGVISYLAERPSVASTLNTDYGHDVLIKVGLLCVLTVPAAYNLRRVGPGLQRLRGKLSGQPVALTQSFTRAVRIEAVLLGLVLVFAALLTLSAPATDSSALASAGATPTEAAPTAPAATSVAIQPSAAPEATDTPSGPVSTTLTLSQTVTGVGVTLTTVHADTDDVMVQLTGAHGPIAKCLPTPAPGADCTLNVKVTFTQLEDNTSDTETAADQGNGQYAVQTGPYLALDGNYQLVVTARRYNQPDDIEAAFRYTVTGAQLTGKIGDYVHVRVDTDPNPAVSGPVTMTFHLTDNAGQPVSDATVSIQGIMPAHGHVSEVTPIKNIGGGSYTGGLLLQMSGGWAVDLTIQRPGHDPTVAEVDLDVNPSAYDLTPYPSPNVKPASP